MKNSLSLSIDTPTSKTAHKVFEVNEDIDADFCTNVPQCEMSITLNRVCFQNENPITGDWYVDVRVGKQFGSLGPFNMPSLGLKAAIAEIDKQFNIKISDKKC